MNDTRIESMRKPGLPKNPLKVQMCPNKEATYVNYDSPLEVCIMGVTKIIM